MKLLGLIARVGHERMHCSQVVVLAEDMMCECPSDRVKRELPEPVTFVEELLNPLVDLVRSRTNRHGARRLTTHYSPWRDSTRLLGEISPSSQ